MNIATVLLLLQATASLLSGAHNNPAVSSTTAAQLVTLGSRTVQLAVQATAPIDFAVPANKSIWPNVVELLSAPYIDANGKYVREGASVELDQGSLSFGDLNNDGFDDAVALVTQRQNDGSTKSVLAAFLNQGGIMFNIADMPLGVAPVELYSHNVVGGLIVMNMKVGGQSRATTTYRLLGDEILKVK